MYFHPEDIDWSNFFGIRTRGNNPPHTGDAQFQYFIHHIHEYLNNILNLNTTSNSKLKD
jgi:hypothetical protein